LVRGVVEEALSAYLAA